MDQMTSDKISGPLKIGNVFELIEFTIDRRLPDGRVIQGLYGVNVIKVREVVRMPDINPLSSRIDGVAGIFELRGVPIPAINLAKILGDPEAPIQPTQQIIVTEFAGKRAGFIVKSTKRIRRVAWDKVLPPSGGGDANITGMTLVENNKFLFILDLEKILADIEGRSQGTSDRAGIMDRQIQQATGTMPGTDPQRLGGGATIVLVDDSRIILNYANSFLTRAGFRVMEATDGLDGIMLLKKLADQGVPVSAIVTDVEMPRMDGISFINEIRKDKYLSAIPIILHTSLSSNSVRETAQNSGVESLVIKNDWPGLLAAIQTAVAQSRARLRVGA